MAATVRTARLDELEYLMGRMDGEVIDLHGTPVWVAEEDGNIVGMISLRLVWQVEPMTVFPEVENVMTRRRITEALYRTAAAWLADRDRNATGVYLAFGITRNLAVLGWAKAKGWFHQYRDAYVFMKRF